MRVLVTGAQGQLGHDVCQRLSELAMESKGIDLADVDLIDKERLRRCFSAYAPDCVVHCAAYTQVDRAESDRESCFAVNEAAVRNLAHLCGQSGAKLVYISTDYVFEGTGNLPYEADAATNPQSVYGQSKLAGEKAVAQAMDRFFIVRTSWLYGIVGPNFVLTMRRLGAERNSLCVVNDQIGSPTYTRDLAMLLCDMIVTEKYGTYHATNEGFCSWYEFAGEIMAKSGLACQVEPISSSEYPNPAKRPLNSRLSKQMLDENGFKRLPPWQDALTRYLAECDEKS